MRLATIQHADRTSVAEIDGDRFHVLSVPDMTTLIASGTAAVRTGQVISAHQARVLAPIPRPRRNLFCVGKNYRAHAREFARSGFDSSSTSGAEDVPALPIFFTKPPESVIATTEPIRYPHGLSQALDYEVELAVVLGTGGRRIEKSAAMRHVFGYTIVNDVTARDLQSAHKQWFLGKSLDTFCPMGPCIVTADELRGESVAIRCWVNGELRQDANTCDLIFDIPTLIATLSAGLTLFPGDIIATGTPAGVGIGFSPPRFLGVGDRVTLEVEGIGRLENTVA